MSCPYLASSPEPGLWLLRSHPGWILLSPPLGKLCQVFCSMWCMVRCHTVSSPSRSSGVASELSLLSFTLVAHEASRCSVLGIPESGNHGLTSGQGYNNAHELDKSSRPSQDKTASIMAMRHPCIATRWEVSERTTPHSCP